jgi:ADP-heptose:LPS heptosyltransferase
MAASSSGFKRLFSWKAAKPEKTVAVIRYGTFGDVLQTASVLPGLKRQGYHITFFCTPRGVEAIRHDPHIDRFVIQNEDIVPNNELVDYFAYLSKGYTKVINMCETVEGIVLPTSMRAHFHWPKAARHMLCDRNYIEMQHLIAEVPYDGPQIRFYDTSEERAWAKAERAKARGRLITWVLTGSGVHKIWPHLDLAVNNLLRTYPDLTIAFLAGPREEGLQGEWNHPRVWRLAGKLSIRQAMAFAKTADVVVGPETGILNAMCVEPIAKIVILSHSTVENLTRDWVNTTSLAAENAPCYPCHQLHLDGWKYCNRHQDGGAMCQTMLKPERVFNAVCNALDVIEERIAA